MAISAPFSDSSGDPITFFAVEESDGIRFVDDGGYLAHLHASGIDLKTGTRRRLLDAILADASAYLDEDTLEIRSEIVSPEVIAKRAVGFLSSLIRVRDLAHLTRGNVESTFREDVIAAINLHMGGVANLNLNEPVVPDLSEFPPDFVVRPKNELLLPAAVYLATSNDRLNEALLLHQEAEIKKRSDFVVLAMIENLDLKDISRKKFQRAQNRGLPITIFRGDEHQAVSRIEKAMRRA